MLFKKDKKNSHYIATVLMCGAHFLGISAESLLSTPLLRSCCNPTLKHLSIIHLTHCTLSMIWHSWCHPQEVTSAVSALRRCSLLRGRWWCDSTWRGKVILRRLHEVSVIYRSSDGEGKTKSKGKWDNGSKLRMMWHPKAHCPRCWAFRMSEEAMRTAVCKPGPGTMDLAQDES